MLTVLKEYTGADGTTVYEFYGDSDEGDMPESTTNGSTFTDYNGSRSVFSAETETWYQDMRAQMFGGAVPEYVPSGLNGINLWNRNNETNTFIVEIEETEIPASADGYTDLVLGLDVAGYDNGFTSFFINNDSSYDEFEIKSGTTIYVGESSGYATSMCYTGNHYKYIGAVMSDEETVRGFYFTFLDDTVEDSGSSRIRFYNRTGTDLKLTKGIMTIVSSAVKWRSA